MSEKTTQTQTTQPAKAKKPVVGNLYKKSGVSATTNLPYNFLSGYINLDNKKYKITVNKSKLKPEERTETSSDYYICLDDYKPVVKTEDATAKEPSTEEEPF